MPLLRRIAGQALLALLSLAVLLPLYFIGHAPSGVHQAKASAAQPHQARRHKSLPKRILLAVPAFALLATMYGLGLVPGGSSSGETTLTGPVPRWLFWTASNVGGLVPMIYMLVCFSGVRFDRLPLWINARAIHESPLLRQAAGWARSITG